MTVRAAEYFKRVLVYESVIWDRLKVNEYYGKKNILDIESL